MNTLPTSAPTTVHWNDPKILEAAGWTPDPVRALLAKHDQGAPTEWAVYQWTSRRKIPDAWRVRLVYCLLREGSIPMAELFRKGSPRRTQLVRAPRLSRPKIAVAASAAKAAATAARVSKGRQV